MDMDVYYSLQDEYDNYFMADSEEAFDGHEDGYEGASFVGMKFYTGLLSETKGITKLSLKDLRYHFAVLQQTWSSIEVG